jgi:L-rhamnose-proton symport protein (RhaT)
VGQILFGISVDRLGLGIAYAIIVGMGAALGTLVPLFVQQRALANEHSIILIVAGVAVMALGIFLTARGGRLREHFTSSLSRRNPAHQGYSVAIFLAVFCGLLAPMLNYSFAFGQDIAQKASRLGNPAIHAAYAVWPIALAGGFLPNAVYSLHLISKRQTWPLFRFTSPDLFWSSLMGVLWMGAFALYGMSAIYLGPLGTSVGWGLLQIFMIMAATASGILTGEWKQAPRHAVVLLSLGLASLAGAICLLTIGSR